jgi:hypothetical protein
LGSTLLRLDTASARHCFGSTMLRLDNVRSLLLHCPLGDAQVRRSVGTWDRAQQTCPLAAGTPSPTCVVAIEPPVASDCDAVALWVGLNLERAARKRSTRRPCLEAKHSSGQWPVVLDRFEDRHLSVSSPPPGGIGCEAVGTWCHVPSSDGRVMPLRRATDPFCYAFSCSPIESSAI